MPDELVQMFNLEPCQVACGQLLAEVVCASRTEAKNSSKFDKAPGFQDWAGDASRTETDGLP